MTHRLAHRRSLAAVAALVAALGLAPQTLIAAPSSAGVPDGGFEGYDYIVAPAPMTEADVLRLADLDGNPAVVTEEEREMMVVLRQVLGLAPPEEID